MNITVIVSVAEFWFQEADLCIFLGAFCTKLKHLAHCGVTIDVCVAALNIGIFLSISLGNSIVSLHKLGLGSTFASALCAVLDVGLSGALEGGFHKDLLYDILNLLDGWDASLNLFFSNADNLVGEIFCAIIAEIAGSSTSLSNSLSDFLLVKRSDLTVAFAYRFEHFLYLQNVLYREFSYFLNTIFSVCCYNVNAICSCFSIEFVKNTMITDRDF